MNMANTATLTDVDTARGAVAVAERTSSVKTVRLPELREMPLLRRQPRDLRPLDAPTVPTEQPLVDADFDSGFALVSRVTVNRGAVSDIALTVDGRRLVVTNFGDDSVSVIDTDTLAVATIGDTYEPFAVVAGTDRAYVRTASFSYDSISVIDTDTNELVATHSVACTISGVAVSSDGSRIYVSRTGHEGADVAVIDAATGQIAASTMISQPGVNAETIRISPDGQRLYVATSDGVGGDLVVIGTADLRVLHGVAVGAPISDIALSGHGDTAFVTSCAGAVDVIDTRTGRIRNTVEVGGYPTQITLSPDAARAYVVNGDQVAVLCTVTDEIVDTITVDGQPSCVVASPDGSRLYIADYAGAITVLAVASTPKLLVPQAMELDAQAMRELVAAERATV